MQAIDVNAAERNAPGREGFRRKLSFVGIEICSSPLDVHSVKQTLFAPVRWIRTADPVQVRVGQCFLKFQFSLGKIFLS